MFDFSKLTPVSRTQNPVAADLLYKEKGELWHITDLAWVRLGLETRGLSLFNHEDEGVVLSTAPEDQSAFLKRKMRGGEAAGKGHAFTNRELKRLLELRGYTGTAFNLEEIAVQGDVTYYRVVPAATPPTPASPQGEQPAPQAETPQAESAPEPATEGAFTMAVDEEVVEASAGAQPEAETAHDSPEAEEVVEDFTFRL